MRNRFALIAATIFLLAGALAHAQFDATYSSVKLVSSVEAIVPGEPFELGLQFNLDEGWHIYWQNSGDSGQPPAVKWYLPDGYEAGPLQFPVPKRHLSGGSIVTNILEGKPVLLVNVTFPARVADRTVKLAGDVRYLICRENCILERTTVSLELPVALPGAQAKPANEKLFRKARRALPSASSKYLTVTAAVDPASLTPGKPFKLGLDIDIKRGFHIQSNEPLNPMFIACDVFLERIAGVSFDSPVFPPPKFRTVKFLGKVSEFEGKVPVHIAGEVDAEVKPGPIRLAGLVKYQACNDKGTCFPPDAVSFTLTTSMAGGSAVGSADVAGAATLADAQKPVDARGALVVGDENAGGEVVQAGEPTLAPDPATVQADPGTVQADEEGLEAFLTRLGVPGQLILCFLYGMLINATPCVLPLLSIKVLSFVQQAHESRSRTTVLGLAFGLGVMIFFVLLGLLASQGKNLLQYPAAVIALVTVVTALALSMLGVFTLQVPTTAARLEASIQKEGVLASFGKGALAPVLGIACTAPMMAGGLAWATQQPPNMAILAFLVMGMGMAFPYVLLGANPNWLSFLPKPGNWMITFERIMGFLLLGLVVLLMHPLVTHLGAEGLEWTLVFLVMVGMACWLLGKVQITMPAMQRWRYRGGATALVVLSALVIYGWVFPLNAARSQIGVLNGGLIAWNSWSAQAVDDSVRAGKTVFVDVTAAYCTNCKVNKAVAIMTQETVEKLKKLGVVAYQADFTGGDEDIFQLLKNFGRPGPPLNLIYPPGQPDKPIVMGVLFSQQTLLDRLDEAGPSRSVSASSLAP